MASGMAEGLHANSSGANDVSQPIKSEFETLTTEKERFGDNSRLHSSDNLPVPEEKHDFHQDDMKNLEELVEEPALDVLENGVKRGMELLDKIKFAIDSVVSTNKTPAASWVTSIQDLQDRFTPSKTVIGVVVNTGAGKSSVLNALLDEERLLPTNCLRACTASPIEVTYNGSDDPAQLYRSDIEFISVDCWLKELKILFLELLDGTGKKSQFCTNPETEAGITYAKVKAVYRKLTREIITKCTAEELMECPTVREVLGSVKQLMAPTAEELYKNMQPYVDSRERNNHLKEMSTWSSGPWLRSFESTPKPPP